MIAIGYIVGIFGDLQNCNKWIVVLGVAVLSILWSFAMNYISEKLKNDRQYLIDLIRE